MRKVFIDADTGIDDAFAHMILATAPNIKIVGAGSCWGSLDAEQTARNTKAVLVVAGRSEVPVAIGARAPLRRSFNAFHGIMGTDGLGDSTHFAALRDVVLDRERSAAEALVATAKAHAGELEVLATGPLTNIAAALTIAPNLAKQIRRLVVMGGAYGAPGNVTPVAEANFWGDPEAVDVVLASGIAVTLVGLDVTSSVLVTQHDLDEWNVPGTLGQLAAGIADPYLSFYTSRIGTRAAPFHDATACAILLEPTIAEYEHRTVAVSCADDALRGFCLVDRRSWITAESPVTIATTVNDQRVRCLLEGALKSPWYAA